MRRRVVSLYVEWEEAENTDAVRKLLLQYGTRMIGTDDETDIKPAPGHLPRRDNTIFRFYLNREVPVHELLSAVAMHPSVYSVGEI